MIPYTITHSPSDDFELLIIPIAGSDVLDSVWPMLKQFASFKEEWIKKDFKGAKGDVHFLYGSKYRVALVGVGENPSPSIVTKVFRQFSGKYKSRIEEKVGVAFIYGNAPTNLEEVLESAFIGLALGCYSIGKYKTETAEAHPFEAENAHLYFILEPEMHGRAAQWLNKAAATAETQMRIIDLVNAPSNKKTPADLSAWALESADTHGYKVRVFDRKQIEKMGLHALLAVNRGSEHPPKFIVAEYGDKLGVDHTIGLVGKGVTFDTGGLSLKPSTNMHYMKSDMGGAAAVMGTMELVAKLKLNIHLVGIVPVTDNSIDALAIKPSDVIDSYSGKSIEVIDTDAEGRLILADGLSYLIQNYKPNVVIDLATLTGSTVRALGYHAAGLFTNNDELANTLSKVGDDLGERVWRLPLWEVYFDDMKSDVADIKNFSGRPIAGAITAAKFLEFFTDEHPMWAHLDIAGVAFNDHGFSNQKSATGFGLRLLTAYIIEEIKARSLSNAALGA